MKYETNSNSLIIENTENGYLSKMILKGKTLVNLLEQQYNIAREITNVNPNCTVSKIQNGIKITFNADLTAVSGYCVFQIGNTQSFSMLKPSTTYTVIYDCKSNFKGLHSGIYISKTDSSSKLTNSAGGVIFKNGKNAFAIRTIDNIPTLNNNDSYVLQLDINKSERIEDAYCQISNVMLIEGDHTQNPPNYFEGLKSVGDGAENIEISSIKSDENLFDTVIEEGAIDQYGAEKTWREYFRSGYIKVEPSATYAHSFKYDNAPKGFYTVLYDINKNFLYRTGSSGTRSITTTEKTAYIRLCGFCTQEGTTRDMSKISEIMLNKGNSILPYQPCKKDKKLLLYKDKDGVWKKPVIRGFDTNNCDLIEELEGGKVRYRKRYGEVTLNGSENGWSSDSSRWNDATVKPFIANAIPDAEVSGNNVNIICDSFKPSNIYDVSNVIEGIYYSAGLNIHVRMSRSELATQDLEGIRKRFQSKPVTFIYKLAKEEVYECTPISVASFKSETTWSIESGAICPSSNFETNYTLNNAVSRVKDVKLFNNAIKENLKHNLKEQKIEVLDTDDTFTLVNKINLTPLKKWVKGTTKSHYDDSSSEHRLKVVGLTFKPSIIFYKYTDSGSNLIRGFYSSFISKNYVHGMYGSYLNDSTNFMIGEDEFTIPLYYRQSSSTAKYSVDWVAYE